MVVLLENFLRRKLSQVRKDPKSILDNFLKTGSIGFGYLNHPPIELNEPATFQWSK